MLGWPLKTVTINKLILSVTVFTDGFVSKITCGVHRFFIYSFTNTSGAIKYVVFSVLAAVVVHVLLLLLSSLLQLTTYMQWFSCTVVNTIIVMLLMMLDIIIPHQTHRLCNGEAFYETRVRIASCAEEPSRTDRQKIDFVSECTPISFDC